MRSVRFDPSTHASIDAVAWARWETRAREASDEMRDWFDARAKPSPNAPLPPQPKFNAEVWGDLKDMILVCVFRGRCAFCEVDEEVNSFGDAEHYRPKRPVEASNAAGKMKPVVVGTDEHPGYGWLAYDWQNLVVACSKCNTFKGNRFPVAKTHCLSPSPGCETTKELNTFEEPLLLHPYFDDPGEHLRFGERGVITTRNNSPRGQATIDVCKLDREPLRAAREREQAHAWREMKELMHEGRSIIDALRVLEARCHDGDARYSLAVLDYLYAKLVEHLAELKARQSAVEKHLAARRI